MAEKKGDKDVRKLIGKIEVTHSGVRMLELREQILEALKGGEK